MNAGELRSLRCYMIRFFYNLLLHGAAAAVIAGVASCSLSSRTSMHYKEIQLTRDETGHCVNTTQCFSPDDQWIVYDGRNHDTMIGSTGTIAMVHTGTGEMKTLYQVPGQSAYGPGVGAATFSPVSNRVLFIHGIRNADKEHPYSITRRTGVAIDILHPQKPLFLDARDVTEPFTNGALRGGTHAHTWTSDGEWISFTYNDFVMEQAAKSHPGIKDLRTIGLLVPGRRITVQPDDKGENNDGEMFALLAVPVTETPPAGSDEVEKAFDETWIGVSGYQKTDGTRQKRAIAYQGNVRDKDGKLKTEIFVADIPDNILELVAGEAIAGTDTTRPVVPAAITHRRITFTEKGVSATPRHWLRSNAEGSLIGFLAEDDKKNIQLFGVSPLGGEIRQLTHHEFSIQGPFNFSPDGKRVAYAADNSVFITEVATGKSERITARVNNDDRPAGAVTWSNSGKMLCYNRYAGTGEMRFLQIFLLQEENGSGR